MFTAVKLDNCHEIGIGIPIHTITENDRVCEKRQQLIQLFVGFTDTGIHSVKISSGLEF